MMNKVLTIAGAVAGIVTGICGIATGVSSLVKVNKLKADLSENKPQEKVEVIDN